MAAQNKPKVGTTVHVDPTTLLLTRNIRDAQPDRDLINSIKAHGVLEPITAVLTEDAGLTVRFGHRRTLAAVEAQVETVPVYVADTDDTDASAEVARIITQRDENTHRVGLTTGDEIAVVEQLAAFGLTPAQISKKARIKRGQVDNALAVSGSELASKATARYEELTLDQAAVVAEFEDDAEAAKALIAAASTGRFEHVAQRARDDRDKAQAEATLTASLTEAGHRVVPRPGYDERTQPISRLHADAETHERITEEEHASCPGQVVWVGWDWCLVNPDGTPFEEDEPDQNATDAEVEAYEDRWAAAQQQRITVPVFGCENPSAHGHLTPEQYYGGAGTKPKAADMSDAEREAAKAQRKLVVENNKAWESAETVRREWVEQYLTRKTPPKGTGAFLAEALAHDPGTLSRHEANRLCVQWAGQDPEKAGYGRDGAAQGLAKASENRAVVVALAQVLACYEAALDRGTWRHDGTHSGAGRYLRFLASCGYTLSEVEEYAISDQTA